MKHFLLQIPQYSTKVVQRMEKIATLKRYALQANAVITGQTSLFLTDLYFHKWNGSFDILLKSMS